MRLADNADFVARLEADPEKYSGDGVPAIERAVVTGIVDAYGISINDVRLHGITATMHGLVIARVVRKPDGRPAFRPPHHIRIRAQLLTGRPA